HNYVYECLADGTVERAFDEWLSNHPYNEGDRVTTTPWDGHVYRCTHGGTSDMAEPEQWDFTPGAETRDGPDVKWVEDSANNPPEYWATWEMRPGIIDRMDPTVYWTPNTVYESNSVVRVKDVYNQVFYTHDGGTSGNDINTPPTVGTVDTVFTE